MLETGTEWGLLALTPLGVTLVAAFLTRSALLAMLLGVVVGTFMLAGPVGDGLTRLFQSSLGNEDFIWVLLIIVLIGVLFEGFKVSGVLESLTARFASRHGALSRRKVELTAWGMGFVIVDDYFSPLLTGAVMRPLSDRVEVPREKLAFLLDSTTASVCILVPFTAWGAYLASLIAAQGVGDAASGLKVFMAAIPYNVYPMLAIGFALLIAAGLIPDFGPMRRAELRVRQGGGLVRPGATPLYQESAAIPDAEALPGAASVWLELLLPVIVVVGVFIGSLLATGSVRIVEAFLAGTTLLMLVLWARGRLRTTAGFTALITRGTQGVVPAILIVALAYTLNGVSSALGVGEAVVNLFDRYQAEGLLVPLAFGLSALVAFATGTSWGAYALMMPVALPVALAQSAGEPGVLVYQTVAAIAGGGIFGDHASPVSDTTVLSSLGAGSDHMDHVLTQLPYATTLAALTFVIYLWL